MRTRRPPPPSRVFRRAAAVALPSAMLVAVLATAVAGCAHAPPTPAGAATTASVHERWTEVAPDRRRLLAGVREDLRCRREVPLGSLVARRVCTTRAEDLMHAEAAAEHVRWGTAATF